MTYGNSLQKAAAVGALALAGLGWGATASASDVFWSVGVASPGVQVAVSNARPVVVQHTYPVLVQPQRVVVQPVPVYHAYPVYGHPVYGQPVYGRPVVVHQAPVVLTGWHGHRRGWHRDGHHDDRGHGNYHQPRHVPSPHHGGHR